MPTRCRVDESRDCRIGDGVEQRVRGDEQLALAPVGICNFASIASASHGDCSSRVKENIHMGFARGFSTVG
jgi:hypothetical protein